LLIFGAAFGANTVDTEKASKDCEAAKTEFGGASALAI